MTDAQLMAAADAASGNLIAAITASQEAELGVRGKYVQARSSHSAIPVDGKTETPDTNKNDWDLLTALPVKLPVMLRVDEYERPLSPSGLPEIKGWVLRAFFTTADGRTFQRAIDSGSEKAFEMPWTEIKPITIL